MAVLQFSNIALKVVKVGVLTKISVYLLPNVAISQTLFANSKYHMTHNFNSTANCCCSNNKPEIKYMAVLQFRYLLNC